MKLSQKCKSAGLKSLAELSELTGVPLSTLHDRNRNDPQQIDNLIRSAVMIKCERAIRRWAGDYGS
jgi:hypothetical protein